MDVSSPTGLALEAAQDFWRPVLNRNEWPGSASILPVYQMITEIQSAASPALFSDAAFAAQFDGDLTTSYVMALSRLPAQVFDANCGLTSVVMTLPTLVQNVTNYGTETPVSSDTADPIFMGETTVAIDATDIETLTAGYVPTIKVCPLTGILNVFVCYPTLLRMIASQKAGAIPAGRTGDHCCGPTTKIKNLSQTIATTVPNADTVQISRQRNEYSPVSSLPFAATVGTINPAPTQFWLTGQPDDMPASAGTLGAGQDFWEMLSDPVEWAGIKSNLSVFQIYDQFSLYTSPTLQAEFFAWAAENDISISYNTGLGVPFSIAQWNLEDFQQFFSLGGTLTYLTLDEPLSIFSYSSATPFTYTVEQLAENIKSNLDQLLPYAPGVKVIDQEPLPHLSLAQLVNWVQTYQLVVGRPLDGEQLDIDWNYGPTIWEPQAQSPPWQRSRHSAFRRKSF